MEKTIIFDMDGVLIDSERILNMAWIECGKIMNMFDIENTIYDCTGLNRADTKVYLKKKYGEDFDYDKFQEISAEQHKKILEHEKILAKPGVHELLAYLKKEGYHIGLASSSRKVNVLERMEEIGAVDFFEKIITGDMVAHSKPDPEIYEIACCEMGVEPKDAIAIEDSANGIISAYRAGMKVLMVPDLRQPTEELEKMLWKKMDSLMEVQSYLESENQ